MKIAALDPGKSGSICLIDDNKPVEFVDMPMLPTGKLIDPVKIKEVIQGWNVEAVVIEKVASSPRMGVSSASNFGANSYGLICLAVGMGIPCYTILPQRWKTVFGLIGKPKDASRLLALKMFPDLKEILKRKGDVDRADALLLGLAWLKMNGNRA